MKKLNTTFVVFILFAIIAFPVVVKGSEDSSSQGSVSVQQEDKHDDDDDDDDEDDGLRHGASRHEEAREHMSVVATEVETLLATPDRQGGIGEQVREIAQEQQQAQLEIQANLDAVETRAGLIRLLAGPNFRAIDNIQAHLNRNLERIEQLTELRDGALYPAEEGAVDEAVAALEQQNETLQGQLEVEESTTSLFGWFFRLFN